MNSIYFVKVVTSQTSSAFKYWLGALLSDFPIFPPPPPKEKEVNNCVNIFIAFMFISLNMYLIYYVILLQFFMDFV